MDLKSTFFIQIRYNMAHLKAKAWGFVNLQGEIEKNNFMVKIMVRKILPLCASQ